MTFYGLYCQLMEIIKLTAVFVIILVLMRLRVPIGVAIFTGGITLSLLFGQKIIDLGVSFFHGATSWKTIRIVLIVSFVSTLGALMKHLRMTRRLVRGIENISGSVKTSLVLLPAIIGLMPMPGGALLSAPLVKEASEDRRISNARLAAINFWFRHILEFCWPIYPGIILSAAIMKIEVATISLWQWPFSVAFLLGGLIFLVFPMKDIGRYPISQSRMASVQDIIIGVWPIVLVVLLTFVFGLELLYSLMITIVVFMALFRPNLKQVRLSLTDGFSFSIISLIAGVMIFQQIITDSGAARLLAEQIATWGVPNWLVLGLASFLIGILTGIVTGYVGIIYPIFLAFLLTPEPDYFMMIIAYGSGLVGVMISPLHLCLVLTRDYFETDFKKVYPLILPPAMFVVLSIVVALALGYAR